MPLWEVVVDENDLFDTSLETLFRVVLICFNAAVFVLAFATTIIDPSDQLVRLERYCKMTNQEFPEEQYDRFCQWCESHVQDKSKHCGKCNRCTSNFDHHCPWLNNCIGGRNYPFFLMLIFVKLLHTILIIILDSFCIIFYFEYFQDEEHERQIRELLP